MTDLVASATHCARCGGQLSEQDLACPACGLLVHAPQLLELSRQAQALEPHDPLAAAQIWQQCLTLLPHDSPQADHLRRRIAALQSGATLAPAPGGWRAAIVRTGGSMLVSMLVYGYLFGQDSGFRHGIEFAVGFVLLIWVHEMGHVIALRRYGVRAAVPLFIPFVGAVITIGRLRNAAEEAIVGIGGPVLGTVGALVCCALYQAMPYHPILLDLAFWGFSINLLNLLPIPPLDGGRVTAAVSPWIWPVGFLALIGLGVLQFIAAGDSIGGVSPILVLIVVFSAPRLWRTFRYQERNAPYYKIKKSASWGIGIAYVLLALLLSSMLYYCHVLGAQ
jgi:Zn-dependent protease